MKKISKGLLLILTLVLTIGLFSTSSDAIDIIYNGANLSSDQMPVIRNSRVFVPLRVIAEACGAKVNYNEAIKQIWVFDDELEIFLYIGDKNMWVNDDDQPVVLDTAPFILNGRTMVPLRALSEMFGMDVEWDNASKTVTLYDNFDGYLGAYIDKNNAGEEVIVRLKTLGIVSENDVLYVFDVMEAKQPYGDGYVADGYTLTVRKDNPKNPDVAELVGHYFIANGGMLMMEYDVATDTYKEIFAVN